MRWEALFEDIEAQMAAADAAGAASELGALVRAEFARTALADRLRGQVGRSLSLRLRDGRWARGEVAAAAPDWVLLALLPEGGAAALLGGAAQHDVGHHGAPPHGQARARLVVPLAAVERLQDVGPSVGLPVGEVERRLGWSGALRALARDRARVSVMLAGGDVSGTLDRVGADHVDVAVHPLEAPRRRSEVTEVATVPFAAVLGVRSAG